MPKKKTLKQKLVAAKTQSKSAAKKKKITKPTTSKQYFSLPDVQQETWNRVVHVIAKMRADGASLTQASREFGLDPRVVRNRAGSALRKTKGGRYAARKSDKLLRVLVVPSPQGLTEVAVRGSEIASKIAEYNDAVQRYLRTGDASRLKKFRRMKLVNEKGERIKLITDLTELQKLGSAGVLSFESLYRSAA
jgi:lambda repressor-like predicted transcriptional regulator